MSSAEVYLKLFKRSDTFPLQRVEGSAESSSGRSGSWSLKNSSINCLFCSKGSLYGSSIVDSAEVVIEFFEFFETILFEPSTCAVDFSSCSFGSLWKTDDMNELGGEGRYN